MIDPSHLLDQAERLLLPIEGATSPRITDRCRAVSATYYAVFHAGLIAAADQLIGHEKRGTSLYALAYRSVDHGKMKSLCKDLVKLPPPEKYSKYKPPDGWDDTLRGYMDIFVTLNDQRMLADYDPAHVITSSEVETYIRIARQAIADITSAEENSRRSFLTLLLFPLR